MLTSMSRGDGGVAWNVSENNTVDIIFGEIVAITYLKVCSDVQIFISFFLTSSSKMCGLISSLSRSRCGNYAGSRAH